MRPRLLDLPGVIVDTTWRRSSASWPYKLSITHLHLGNLPGSKQTAGKPSARKTWTSLATDSVTRALNKEM